MIYQNSKFSKVVDNNSEEFDVLVTIKTHKDTRQRSIRL